MSDEATVVTPRPQRNQDPLVAGLVTGVLVCIGVAALMWPTTNSDDSGARVEGDVATACSLIQRNPWTDKSSESADDFSRWFTAATLARAAAITDSRYQPFADDLEASSRIYSETDKGEGPEFDQHVQKVRDFCDSI